MSTEDWVKLEDSNIPHFTTENLGNYFITRTALDGRPANDCKNVNSHAYPLEKDIYNPYIQKFIPYKVCWLTRNEKIYKINVVLDSFGDVT